MVCPPCIPPTHTYNFESVPYRPVARVATVTTVAKIAMVTTMDSISDYLLIKKASDCHTCCVMVWLPCTLPTHTYKPAMVAIYASG